MSLDIMVVSSDNYFFLRSGDNYKTLMGSDELLWGPILAHEVFFIAGLPIQKKGLPSLGYVGYDET